nr:Peptide methionine sulfoxide reductase [uncultured bacterium]
MRILSTIFFMGVFIMANTATSEDKLVLNPLTPEEERVIVHKGTEMPHTGQYDKFNEKGGYVCRRCNAPLYRSEDKFDAGCGWPSFDAEIPGAVKRTPDSDGMRTEITCARCDAHLGHVFIGERLTTKNTRHCVNSISMKFVPAAEFKITTDKPAASAQATTETAVFASGCFWGSEHVFLKIPGVISTRVGYTGGRTANPTYKQVCTGTTGHTEAVEVVFDKTKTNYETMAKLFFETHDPTQVNRQGPDIGDQYRSVVFFANDEQKAVAQRLIAELQKKGLKVATKLEKATTFWPAEDYHQKYYTKTGGTPYCHIPRKLF